MNRKREKATPADWGVWILAAALLLKIALLVTSQSGADGDEAVVGMMAKHMLEGKEFPLVFYGQNYGGGATVEALIAALYFAVFGMSSVTLKAAGLTIFMALLVMTYAFAKRSFGVRPALIAVSCLALWPTFVEWGLKTRGGHVLSAFCGVAICYVYCYKVRPSMQPSIDVSQAARRQYRNGAFLLGLLCGLSIWVLQMNAVIVLVILLFWLVLELRWRRADGLLLLALGGILGVTPLAVHAILAGQSVVATVFQPGDGLLAPSILTLRENLGAVWEWIGPSFFTPHLDHDSAIYYGGRVPVYGTALFVIALAATAWLVWTGVKLWTSSVARAAPSAVPRSLVTIFVVAYVIFLCLIGPGLSEPRYFLPLAPFLAMSVALLADALIGDRHRIARLAGIGVVVLSLGLGGVVHARWLTRPASFVSAGSVSEYLEQKDVVRMVRFLRDKNIGYAYIPDNLLEWKTLFEGREQIIAVRLGSNPRYKPYAVAINRGVITEGKPYAIVLLTMPDAFSRITKQSVDHLLERTGEAPRLQSFGKRIVVYYGFQKPVFPPL